MCLFCQKFLQSKLKALTIKLSNLGNYFYLIERYYNLRNSIMPITDLNALQQAIANVRLESLEISPQLQALLQEALLNGKLTTGDIIEALHH